MFVELKAKSNFSFLRGASSARELVLSAHVLEMPALGICDINGVYSLPRAFETILNHAPNLKLICGADIVVENHPNITLIAKTRSAWGLLCRILTQVHAGKEKGEGFLTLSDLLYLCERFEGVKDLVCLPDFEAEKTNLNFLSELFPGNLYLPLCRYLDGLDEERTRAVKKAASDFQLPIVATNDVHYHTQDRRPLQDCLTGIRERISVGKPDFRFMKNDERYLKSALQMRALFYDLPQAVSNTLKVASECTFSLSDLKYSYPQEFIPQGHTAKSYLEELVLKGAQDTYRGLVPPKVDAQIRRELKFFEERGLEHYFLTVFDYVDWAKRNNIICQGRGSAANSVVCYLLRITSVDPVHMNLLFDRFMNAGRNEPPDIDVDFEHERREEVIQYIYRRFGRERAGMVAAVRTYRKKSAFIELSKALGVEVGTLSAGELKTRFLELSKELNYRGAFLPELIGQLKSFPRHLSIHSGGFVLSHSPLVEIVPIEPARMPGRTIVQWDKDDLETVGLMKVDVLSIGFLTALHKSCDLAGINWRDIPEDDPATFKMIQRAETHGTFQIESRAQMNMLVQTLPEVYYDLVIQVAVVRPSPTYGGMIQPFLKGLVARRRGEKYRIGNEKLEAILGRTCGIPIFQEQIMQISIDVAGYSAAEADQLRRSLGKARTAESVDATGKKLYEALISCGVSTKFADDLFSYIQGYAHYGFPESHAASYASLAYKSAYMKRHHPAELLIGLINSQPMGFYPVDTLINEAKRNGVKVLPIHPNISAWDATLEAPKTVRMGFRNIEKINQSSVQHLISTRAQKSFTSIEDFILRTKLSKDVLENLALTGAFLCWRIDRRHSFWQSIEFQSLMSGNEEKQISLFDERSKFEPRRDLFSQMSLLEEQTIDYRKVGYSLEGNLMKSLRLETPHLPPLISIQARKLPRGRHVRYAGILTVIQRPPPAKGTAFITLEDEHGNVDLILRNEIYEKYKSTIEHSRFLIVEGKVQRKGRGMTIIVSSVEAFGDLGTKKSIEPQQSPRAIHKLDLPI